MPKRTLTPTQQQRLKYLRARVREAGLTLHTRLRRVNVSATAELPSQLVREYLRELLGFGYQIQTYIPSANPRQDQESKDLSGPRCLRAGVR